MKYPLREVAYCDVIKCQMTSWLTLNGDMRQKLTFKGNSGIFARIFTKQWIKIYFFSQQDADHVAGDRACTLMSRMETRTSSLIIFFTFVDCHKQTLISVYEDTKVHYEGHSRINDNEFISRKVLLD